MIRISPSTTTPPCSWSVAISQEAGGCSSQHKDVQEILFCLLGLWLCSSASCTDMLLFLKSFGERAAALRLRSLKSPHLSSCLRMGECSQEKQLQWLMAGVRSLFPPVLSALARFFSGAPTLGSLCFLEDSREFHCAFQRSSASHITQLHNSTHISGWRLARCLRSLSPPVLSLHSSPVAQPGFQPLPCAQNHQMIQREKCLQMPASELSSCLQNFSSSGPCSCQGSLMLWKMHVLFLSRFSIAWQ